MRPFFKVTTGVWRIVGSVVATALLGAVVIAFQAPSPSHAGDGLPALIVHDKDFPKEPAGISVLAWSPDSRRIAYVQWLKGEVAIADVATGAVRVIPNFEMDAIRSIAWSLDGKLLAVNSGTELKILRADTFQITHAINVFPPLSNGGHMRFFQSIFSNDGASLILQNPNQYGPTSDVVLWRFDLSNDDVRPLLKKPPLGKRSSEDSSTGRFQRAKGRLYYSTMFLRGDDIVRAPKLMADRGGSIGLIPSTCFVFEFAADLNAPGVRRMDFPAIGEKPLDDSKYPFRCDYSAASDRFLTFQRMPFFINGKPAVPLEPIEWFFTSHALSSGVSSPQFGMKPAAEEGRFAVDQFEFHPREPWLVTLAYPAMRQLLTVWNIESGQALARIQPSPDPAHDLDNPHISPDGERAAFVIRGTVLSLYRFSHL